MKESEIILYTTPQGNVKIEIRFEEETFWLTQKKLAELFDVEVHTINYHLKEIFKSGELNENSTIRKIRIVQTEGAREVSREVDFYNLDAIIAVGYRVNSYNATQFRIWATNTLKEYILKGFALDDDRLKESKKLFGKDYFKELLERIRSIRASERRIYQQITDIFDELGESLIMEERLFPAATAMSCAIAYAMRYVRANVEGGVEMGFKAKDAQKIVLQTVKGAVELLQETGEHPEAAIDKVTTPGGCTIKGLNTMEQNGFTNAVIKGLIAGKK